MSVTSTRIPPGSDLTVEGLHGKGEAFYTEWLLRGIHSYLFGSEADNLPQRSEFSFPGAEHVVGRRDFISDGLADVEYLLPFEDRRDYAKACSAALGTLDVERDQDAAVAETIIRLAVQIGAAGVLRVLAGAARRTVGRPGADRLYRLAMETARELAGPGCSEAADCISQIIRNRTPFPPSLARTALLALCEAAPERLLNHLRLLYEPMEHVYEVSSDPEAEKARQVLRRGLILEVASIVPYDEVLGSTCRAGARRMGPRRFREPSLDWWVRLVRNDISSAMTGLRQRLGIEEPAVIDFVTTDYPKFAGQPEDLADVDDRGHRPAPAGENTAKQAKLHEAARELIDSPLLGERTRIRELEPA